MFLRSVKSRFLCGFVRQSWTKSYRTFCVTDLEKLKKLSFHSVYITDWCAPPRLPLSSVRLYVSKGPSLEITKLALSLIEFLEAVAINDSQHGRLHSEAFEVLNTALKDLTDQKRRSGLSWDLTNILDELLLNMNTNTEETVNMTIVNHILLLLTRSFFILNKGNSKVLNFPKWTYLPETFRWDGLALGHRNAWFGELDMVVCPLIAGDAQPKVGVLWEKCHMESLDDAYWEESDDEEGLSSGSTAVEEKKHIPKNRSLFGSHFSQGFATAVAFSYVYHYKLSVDTNSTCSSLLPTIQISPRGYQVFLYDCLQDIMLANNFFWTRESLIYLWAILHHHLFFPGKLDSNLVSCVPKFGYDKKGSGFFANRNELVFGESLKSEHFWRDEPQEGRMIRR